MKWRAHSQIFLWSAERRSQNECLPLGKIRNWYLILGKTSVFLQLKRGNLSQECIGVKEVRTNRSTYNKSINFLSLISISYNFPFIIYWSQRTGDLNTLIINGDLSSRQIRGDWGVSRERPEDPASASRSSSGPGDGREFSFGGKGITVTTAAIYSQAARGALTILKRFQSTFFAANARQGSPSSSPRLTAIFVFYGRAPAQADRLPACTGNFLRKFFIHPIRESASHEGAHLSPNSNLPLSSGIPYSSSWPSQLKTGPTPFPY